MGGSKTREQIRINLLGPVELRHGEQLLTVPARKDRALLAVVALAQGGSILRTRLAGLLWGESSERRARDSLKQSLLRLRRVAHACEVELLIADRQSVSLGSDVAVDVHDLIGAGDDGNAKTALDLRRGPFLEGLNISDPGFHDWFLAERARLDVIFSDLALHQMRQAEVAGNSRAAAYFAQRLLTADPTNEDATRTIMRAHLERGQRRLALQVYETARARMVTAFDIEPEPETIELAHQIRSDPAHSIGTLPAAAPMTNDMPTVAVLPFATFPADPAQNYFADGLTEDIITDLGGVSDVKVVMRSAAFALKGRRVGAAEVARMLGVSHVLQGSVRHEGDSVRVTARLIEGGEGRQIWASRFDRPMTDIFLLQEELSRCVVGALSGVLNPKADVMPRRGTKNVEAYKLLLKARSFYFRGLDRHNIRTARFLLIQAVECDPDYAEAYALLAMCEFYMSMRLTSMTNKMGRPSCRELAHRASQLEPDRAEVRAAVGLAFYEEARYQEANRELAVAAQLDSDLFEPPFFLARSHRLRGEHTEAARLFALAVRLRPEDYRSCGLLAEELQALDRKQDAVEALEQAAVRLEATVERHPDNTDALAFGASIYAELGRVDQAREWCRWAMVLGGDENLVPFNYNLARAHALLGEPENALERLERLGDASIIVRNRIADWIATDLALTPLFNRQVFKRLMVKLRQPT